MPHGKKETPKGYPARAAERFKKKRSIIMDTLFGRDDDPATPEDESKADSLIEGAKNFIFGKKALQGAADKMKDKKKK